MFSVFLEVSYRNNWVRMVAPKVIDLGNYMMSAFFFVMNIFAYIVKKNIFFHFSLLLEVVDLS